MMKRDDRLDEACCIMLDHFKFKIAAGKKIPDIDWRMFLLLIEPCLDRTLQ